MQQIFQPTRFSSRAIFKAVQMMRGTRAPVVSRMGAEELKREVVHAVSETVRE